MTEYLYKLFLQQNREYGKLASYKLLGGAYKDKLKATYENIINYFNELFQFSKYLHTSLCHKIDSIKLLQIPF